MFFGIRSNFKIFFRRRTTICTTARKERFSNWPAQGACELRGRWILFDGDCGGEVISRSLANIQHVRVCCCCGHRRRLWKLKAPSGNFTLMLMSMLWCYGEGDVSEVKQVAVVKIQHVVGCVSGNLISLGENWMQPKFGVSQYKNLCVESPLPFLFPLCYLLSYMLYLDQNILSIKMTYIIMHT